MADHEERTQARAALSAPANAPDPQVLDAVHEGLLGVEDDGPHSPSSAGSRTLTPAKPLAARRRS